ncbi:MAG: FAD binding domain-containing protein [Firmicutes bacterium]|nr:FAD binding domain-containing protein [Bacillota bacterium]
MEIKNYHKARSIDEAYQLLSSNPKNSVIGGGAWMKKSSPTIETLIDLKDLKLDQIIETESLIEIGAMVTLHQLETDQSIIKLGDGFVSQSLSEVLGVGFRNIATIGGSIVGRYAFSDIIPTLLTLPVHLVFYPAKEMTLEAFLNAKGKVDDILTHIVIKKIKGQGFFKKVAQSPLEFAILNVAIFKDDQAYKIAIGSRPSGAILAEEAMAYLNKQKVVNDEVVEQTANIVLETIKFGSNRVASEDYRKALAKAYVKRGIKEVTFK